MPTFGWKFLILRGKECFNLINHKNNFYSWQNSLEFQKKWDTVGASVKFSCTNPGSLLMRRQSDYTPLIKRCPIWVK